MAGRIDCERKHVIEAAIFDMDGLLIDSEPLWEAAEMVLFPELGVPLTPVLKKETTGLRTEEIVDHWHSRYPWSEPKVSVVAACLVQRLSDLVMEQGVARKGAHEALDVCARAGLPMAIASSSPMALIESVLDKLAIRRYFTILQSAEHEPFGKPHPGVYISTARRLGVRPDHCLAFEDSPNGVLAAKAAKMICIAVPDDALRTHPAFCIADRVLASLADFDAAALRELT